MEDKQRNEDAAHIGGISGRASVPIRVRLLRVSRLRGTAKVLLTGPAPERKQETFTLRPGDRVDLTVDVFGASKPERTGRT